MQAKKMWAMPEAHYSLLNWLKLQVLFTAVGPVQQTILSMHMYMDCSLYNVSNLGFSVEL